MLTTTLRTDLSSDKRVRDTFTGLDGLRGVNRITRRLRRTFLTNRIRTTLKSKRLASTMVLRISRASTTNVLLSRLSEILTTTISPITIRLGTRDEDVYTSSIRRRLTIMAGRLRIVIIMMRIGTIFLRLRDVLVYFLNRVRDLLMITRTNRKRRTSTRRVTIRLATILGSLLVIIKVTRRLTKRAKRRKENKYNTKESVRTRLISDLTRTYGILDNRKSLESLGTIVTSVNRLTRTLMYIGIERLDKNGNTRLGASRAFIYRNSFLLLSIFYNRKTAK